MKILIVPDSFKGTLTSKEVCDCIKSAILSVDGTHEITALPFADGGEGFAECMQNICKGASLYVDCHDIYGKAMKGHIVTFDDTAVIDTATASGLQAKKNIMRAGSYGTGELIKSAVSLGFRHIILGLGGSGCCDGGAGALAALGADFYDINYRKIKMPCSGDLNEIYGVGFKNIVKGIHFTFACDVENKLFGENGAAYVFAPQKGANKTQVQELDEGLKRLNAFLPTDVRDLAGGGAAGGICGGLYAVYGGEVKSGFDILSKYAKLEKLIQDCDLIITGEGKTDEQTLMGKLPFQIYRLAQQYGKQCVLISGSIETDKIGDKRISLTDGNITSEEAMQHAKEILFEKAKYILQ